MAAVLAAIFNVLVALVLPVAAVVWFAIRRRQLVVPWLLGALTFFVTQGLLRSSLLSFLGGQAWYSLFQIAQPALYSLLLGLSAGVFEELGRYAAMRLDKKERHTWQAAIAFGLGHGGLEAMLLVGINYLVMLLAQLGMPGLVPLPQAGLALLAGCERLFAMLLHVGWSVMVMRAVQRRNLWWLLLAVALHGLVDGLLGIFQLAGASVYIIELYVALAGLGALGYTVFTVRKELHNAKKATVSAEEGPA